MVAAVSVPMSTVIFWSRNERYTLSPVLPWSETLCTSETTSTTCTIKPGQGFVKIQQRQMRYYKLGVLTLNNWPFEGISSNKKFSHSQP